MEEERLERLRVRLMEEMDPENAEEDAEIMRKITALTAEEHRLRPMPLAERSRLARELFSSVRGLGILQHRGQPKNNGILAQHVAQISIYKFDKVC